MSDWCLKDRMRLGYGKSVKHGVVFSHSGYEVFTSGTMEVLRKKLIDDLKDICIRDEHDPNEFMYCGCQDEAIKIINKRFGVDK